MSMRITNSGLGEAASLNAYRSPAPRSTRRHSLHLSVSFIATHLPRVHSICAWRALIRGGVLLAAAAGVRAAGLDGVAGDVSGDGGGEASGEVADAGVMRMGATLSELAGRGSVVMRYGADTCEAGRGMCAWKVARRGTSSAAGVRVGDDEGWEGGGGATSPALGRNSVLVSSREGIAMNTEPRNWSVVAERDDRPMSPSLGGRGILGASSSS